MVSLVSLSEIGAVKCFVSVFFSFDFRYYTIWFSAERHPGGSLDSPSQISLTCISECSFYLTSKQFIQSISAGLKPFQCVSISGAPGLFISLSICFSFSSLYLIWQIFPYIYLSAQPSLHPSVWRRILIHNNLWQSNLLLFFLLLNNWVCCQGDIKSPVFKISLKTGI